LVQRAVKSMNSRLSELRQMFKEMQLDDDEKREEAFQGFNEYGLCFDYVPKGTFGDQKRSYFRYQISWGGPSEEIRFFTDETLEPTKIEFWFLDWFCGHGIKLSGRNLETALNIWREFKDNETVEYEMQEALA
ncbi:MAG: hypothetical protein KKB31_06410, partial [Nanoarchaeota archaeon]|nr:hypothetical protein [Nanoarchaeota archaeon]